MFSISLFVSVWLLVVTSWHFSCKKTAIKVHFWQPHDSHPPVSLHQADMHWRAGLQFQWDWSVASHHWPVCQYAYLCCRSQLPCPASTRGECAHRFGDFNQCVFTVCSESHWCARFTDGQLEEGNCAVSTFQQAGVFARGDGRHAEAQSHQPQQQQVSLLCLLYFFIFFYFLEPLAWF